MGIGHAINAYLLFDAASSLEDEAAISSAMLGYDQEDLRKAREEQLRNNASMPLASSQQVHTVKHRRLTQ